MYIQKQWESVSSQNYTVLYSGTVNSLVFRVKALRSQCRVSACFFQVVLLYNHSAQQDCGIVDNHLFTSFSGTIV